MHKWYQREIIWHALFWIAYLVLRLAVIRLYAGSFGERLLIELMELPLKMFALYFLIYVVINKILAKRKYIQAVVIFLCYLMAIAWLNRVEDYYLIFPLTGSSYTQNEAGFWSWRVAAANLIYIYPVVGLGTTVYFVKSWFDNQLLKEKMAREKAVIELKSLKDQIHPHFLFNTLNNIYSLALSDSKKTPEMMMRLSKLLEFMIYECNRNKILISREMSALRDYIELERLRLGDRLEIAFRITGDIERVSIAPLLFFPLVENCFKHGSHQTSERVWIRFNLQLEGKVLEAQIENSLPDGVKKNETPSGIGLENVRQRLNYLYPNHEIRVHAEDTYLVHLKIFLDDTMPDR